MGEWLEEVMSRKSMVIDDHTNVDDITKEMSERLEALLTVYNGCEANEDGWRRLAVQLALEFHPLFKVQTPADRDQQGGKPVGMENFIRRSMMNAELKKGGSQRAAAKKVSKRLEGSDGLEASPKRLENLMSAKSAPPDEWAVIPYKIKAEKAAISAAEGLSHLLGSGDGTET